MLRKLWLVLLMSVVLIGAGLFLWWRQRPPTIEDLWEHPEVYVGMVVEITGEIVDEEIVDEMYDYDAGRYMYTFSDGTGSVQFLWFPERLSESYTISGEVTAVFGPRPSIDPFADYMKGVVMLASSFAGYYDWHIQNITRVP